ncbi:FtsK/SpoIIIE family DNA translocase [Caenispirillum bisanense]|uniref:DNA translocase FtsK n=1 Tax=Caenispirillum bisanense TaxID=414052 RepID=A0A286GB58_9PROT|nr:DNA translocase FtsK 4TM domain-containing protein [Caenispirillum bisanense]SOD92740.1 DNA translocase FtsK [Caenispirillum bisanense]
MARKPRPSSSRAPGPGPGSGSGAARALTSRLLPPELVTAARGMGLRLVGLALVVAAGVVATALLTHTPGDPSWNTASARAPLNALGLFGATLSDLLLQSFGLAAVLPLLAVLSWGVRLISGQHVSAVWLRTVGLIACAILLSLGLGALPKPPEWPIAAGLGGAAGALLLRSAVTLGGESAGLIAAIGGAAGALLFLWVAHVRFDEWRRALASVRGAPDAVLGLGGKAKEALARRREEAAATPVPEEPRRERRRRVDPTVTGRREPILGAPQPTPPEPVAPVPDLVVARPRPAAPSKRELESRQGSLLPPDPHEGWVHPPLDLLTPPDTSGSGRLDEEALSNNARMLEGVLSDFGVNGQIVKVRPGPVVTLYELEPAPGTKTSRVIGLADDIARSMAAVSVRIAVIPGRSVIGIELPNARREMVAFRELVAADDFHKTGQALCLALGKDIGGGPQYVDLARMPHLLIAGTTGSGKSVAVNTMICSLLYRLTPDQCRFIMIDPKMLELSVYDGIPHLLAPVVTDPGKAVVALKWAVREMENRYRLMSQLGVRNIAGYNAKVAEALKTDKGLTRTVQTGFDAETGKPVFEQQALDLKPLPFIVVIVDEMADLMLVAGKDVEAAIQRLAQMARAAGIHLIMATQRPSVDVITGTIKANFPTRISFQVTSKIDSRTILGEQGAEQLLGQGDMLYMAAGGRISRVHGPFISDEDVERVVGHLRDQGEPDYVDSVTEEDEEAMAAIPGFGAGGGGAGGEEGGNDLYDQAVALVCRERKASTSFVQRHLQIGYNRAARIIERMEKEGVVSRANHVGKREVLAPPMVEMD